MPGAVRRHIDGIIVVNPQDHVRRQTRFTSKKPAKEIMGKMEEAAKALGFTVQTRSYKVSFWFDNEQPLFSKLESYRV